MTELDVAVREVDHPEHQPQAEARPVEHVADVVGEHLHLVGGDRGPEVADTELGRVLVALDGHPDDRLGVVGVDDGVLQQFLDGELEFGDGRHLDALGERQLDVGPRVVRTDVLDRRVDHRTQVHRLARRGLGEETDDGALLRRRLEQVLAGPGDGLHALGDRTVALLAGEFGVSEDDVHVVAEVVSEEPVHHPELALPTATVGHVASEPDDPDHLVGLEDRDTLHPDPSPVLPLGVHPVLRVDTLAGREPGHRLLDALAVGRVDALEEPPGRLPNRLE